MSGDNKEVEVKFVYFNGARDFVNDVNFFKSPYYENIQPEEEFFRDAKKIFLGVGIEETKKKHQSDSYFIPNVDDFWGQGRQIVRLRNDKKNGEKITIKYRGKDDFDTEFETSSPNFNYKVFSNNIGLDRLASYKEISKDGQLNYENFKKLVKKLKFKGQIEKEMLYGEKDGIKYEASALNVFRIGAPIFVIELEATDEGRKYFERNLKELEEVSTNLTRVNWNNVDLLPKNI